MHRVGRSAPALPCTASRAVRLYTTPPPVKSRVPLKKWGDLVIPSRQEVIDLRAKRSTADINYLKFENEKSLAARLARPTIDLTLARKQALEKNAQPPASDAAEAMPNAPSEQAESPSPLPTPAAILESMITQRREARLKRESERLAQKQRAEAERAVYEELRLAREARKKEIEQEKKAKIHSAINEFQPLSAQLSTFKKTVDPQAEKRREYIVKLAADLAEKRKLEREEREKEYMESEQSTRKDRRQSFSSSRRPTSSLVQEDEDFENELSEIEQSSYEAEEPQLLPPTPLVDLFLRGRRKSVSDRTEGGDYSLYVPPSTSFGTTPDELGAAGVAQVALSHRRDVSLPQRHQSLELINKALVRKSKPRAVT
ncbi:hypothetical protein BJ912DRAFT_1052696 [Pholiota molesta]|nr:hypothetical protein BJ912DRAFT_1052696 [Pholiota molesta]